MHVEQNKVSQTYSFISGSKLLRSDGRCVVAVVCSGSIITAPSSASSSGSGNSSCSNGSSTSGS